MIRQLFLCLILSLGATAIAQQDLGAPSSNAPSITMLLPDLKGAIRVNVAGLRVQQSGLRADGHQFRIQAESPEGLFITAFMEVGPHPATSTDVRNAWWPETQKNTETKLKEKLSDLELHDVNSAAVTEYTVHKYNGVPIEQHNMHAYFGGEQTWVEVHLSKVKYDPNKDAALFEAFMSRVEILPTYEPNARDLMGVASSFYQAQNYKSAAHFYELALEADQRSAILGSTLWHVAVDNLGMSYGISGDLEHSKQVFENAIAKDPNYPLFEYNLACYYGEKNDLSDALAHLKRAFELRKNALPGETMPDPMGDDSFRKFKKNPQFVEAVNALPRS